MANRVHTLTLSQRDPERNARGKTAGYARMNRRSSVAVLRILADGCGQLQLHQRKPRAWTVALLHRQDVLMPLRSGLERHHRVVGDMNMRLALVIRAIQT